MQSTAALNLYYQLPVHYIDELIIHDPRKTRFLIGFPGKSGEICRKAKKKLRPVVANAQDLGGIQKITKRPLCSFFTNVQCAVYIDMNVGCVCAQ